MNVKTRLPRSEDLIRIQKIKKLRCNKFRIPNYFFFHTGGQNLLSVRTLKSLNKLEHRQNKVYKTNFTK